jgi:23S rRNA (uracil1939-C5)-methyltransferase
MITPAGNQGLPGNPALAQLKSVEVHSVAAGGKGVARIDGKVFFIADAVPGDVVDIEVTHDSGRYADARITGFVQPAPIRGRSNCRFSDDCGGCQWQEIPYEQQLAWKRQFVESALGRVGKVEAAVPVAISGSADVLGYRNRIFVRGVFRPDGSVTFGYFKRGSRDLVPIDRCAIASPVINGVLADLGSAKFKRPADLAAETPYRMELQEIPPQDHGQRAGVVITVYPPRPDCPELDAFSDGLRGLSRVQWVGLVKDLKDAPAFYFEEDHGIRYFTRPGQFQQVNVPHNRLVRATVREMVDGYRPDRILDLFCGSGNLSLGLCRDGRYVEGIEFSTAAIATARENVARNGITNAMYLSGSAEKHLWKCARKEERFDVVIADPPREGMFKELIPLSALGARAIIYVSCDPATLSRDIGSLLKLGYSLKFVRAFDFFPNTWHVESLAVLEKNS